MSGAFSYPSLLSRGEHTRSKLIFSPIAIATKSKHMVLPIKSNMVPSFLYQFALLSASATFIEWLTASCVIPVVRVSVP
jgi:hypothetical protein